MPSIYGKEGDEQITKDAKILFDVTGGDASQLQPEAPDLWDRFLAAGGDDSHSGGSWFGVKSECMALINQNQG